MIDATALSGAEKNLLGSYFSGCYHQHHQHIIITIIKALTDHIYPALTQNTQVDPLLHRHLLWDPLWYRPPEQQS